MIAYISATTGALTILWSLYLISIGKITLRNASNNPNITNEALIAEFGKYFRIVTYSPAIALFLVGLVLIIYPLVISQGKIEKYHVRGATLKSDGNDYLQDITISSKYPPHNPASDGSIVGLEVWKGPDGRFPKLSLLHPDYQVTPVDLNDREKVELNGTELNILNTVELALLPGG